MKDLYRPHLLNLEELLENKIFNIPVYQRPYSWNHEQVGVLLDDINQYFNDDTDLFIGTLYAKNKGLKTSQIYEYELVDGQQRIVTISFILIVLYSLLILKGADENKREVYRIKNILWKYANRINNRDYHLINSRSLEGDILRNIFDNSFDSIAMFEKYIRYYSTNNSIDENIKNVFILIYKHFSSLSLTSEELLDFSDFLLGKINIIMIESNVPNKIIFNMFEAIYKC